MDQTRNKSFYRWFVLGATMGVKDLSGETMFDNGTILDMMKQPSQIDVLRNR
jgi:hypothetical protein